MAEEALLGVPTRALDILLRLPPLYLMDSILMQEMALSVNLFGGADPDLASATLTTGEGHKVRITEAARGANLSASLEAAEAEAAAHASASGEPVDPHAAWAEVYAKIYGGSADAAVLPYYLLNLALGAALYAAASFVLTLSLRQLLVFYAYLAAFLCLPLSYFSHGIMTETLGQLSAMTQQAVDVGQPVGDPANAEWFLHRILFSSSLFSELALDTRAILANYLVQTALGLVLASVLRLHFDNKDLLTKVVTLSLVSPNVLAVINAPVPLVELAAFLSLVLPLMLTAMATYSVAGRTFHAVVATIKRKKQFVVNFGLNVFLEAEWTRLRVPALLRTFWLSRIGLHLLTEGLAFYQMPLPAALPAMNVVAREAGNLAQRLVTRGAETIIAVLGMTSVVSSICYYIGTFFSAVLAANSDAEDQDEKSVASISAILFFVLALQTGLTSLEPEKRFARLCKNLCLLLTALFHSIHNMVVPVLMSLSASHNYNSRRHIRALLICVFLVLAPIALLTYLWQAFNVGTWLLAVTAFCIEVIVQVLVTVSVYLLFLYDQYLKDGMWESLDDAVYYVKATGSSVEFCFAVFLFFNGGWILVFESGGTIRAVMMLIHAYCNIWLEAKSGWKTFMKRRTAASKINSLPDASEEELQRHDDVCAICYQEMTSRAKVTRCRHYFHGVCLRKWLYVQDSCPLCHGALYNKSSLAGGGNGAGNNNNNEGEGAGAAPGEDGERQLQEQQLRQDEHDQQQQQYRQQRRGAADGVDDEEDEEDGDFAESEVEEDMIDNDASESDDSSSTTSSRSSGGDTSDDGDSSVGADSCALPSSASSASFELVGGSASSGPTNQQPEAGGRNANAASASPCLGDDSGRGAGGGGAARW